MRAAPILLAIFAVFLTLVLAICAHFPDTREPTVETVCYVYIDGRPTECKPLEV